MTQQANLKYIPNNKKKIRLLKSNRIIDIDRLCPFFLRLMLCLLKKNEAMLFKQPCPEMLNNALFHYIPLARVQRDLLFSLEKKITGLIDMRFSCCAK